MNCIFHRRVFALALGLLFVGATIWAQGSKAQAPTLGERAASTLEALAILERSTEFMSQVGAFHVVFDIGFDVVQETGQKIEFGEMRSVTISRPGRAHVDFVRRDGVKGSVFYDGKDISIYSPDENLYAQVARPGGLQQAFRYLSDELNVPIPMSDFFAANSFAVLTDQIESASYVGESVVADVASDHLAFSNDEVDYQLWIAQGERPLLQRVVITYRLALGEPQFWGQVRTWDLAPETPQSLFTFTPPDGAGQIPFASLISPDVLEGEEQ